MKTYAQATFGDYKRLYTFKVDDSVHLEVGKKYDVVADDTTYSTPIKIQKLFVAPPGNLEGIYLKTIKRALVVEEEPKSDTEFSEISFIQILTD